MPLGVPKVPFDFDVDFDRPEYEYREEDEESTWVDLYNALYKKRQLFLFQDVNSEIANQLINLFLYLDSENDITDFCLYIDSPGGWILPGISLYNVMEAVESDIRTICVGLAASMASFILAVGNPNKRVAFPHAGVMIHQPHASFLEEDDDDDADDNDDNDDDDDNDDNNENIQFLREMDELMIIQEDIAKIYAERTNQPLGVILKDLQSDSFMSATEAQAHGIVDFVAHWERRVRK
uniref:ATP-dependent Clp protease proteolytic subunit n=3 Tax=Passiflora TaxID=3684 RepID=A0A1U9HWF7_PASED|nr:clp protease proteolytic subunit [Passiflora edulis]YP_010023575.1 ATP-dependent Clp protease proteolytic subunit [Passiflora caerulea]QVL28883.1 clp protease proteolytic subunit [Passiflora edulis f. flavicarpa]APL97543.1 clp protease proteolytic subunit [Passiflora edulis]AXB37576.1 Clp protease proteolytic subunit [Passiflora edulis]QNZ92576.1 clp protease proteolytic subunit [Passiflora edulis]QOP62924.1 ATP-dependent Clp protease proteolytic subunit [Passiflora caerulea]